MANFDLYKQTALNFEGGYQSIVSDPGNYNSQNELVGTNNGISAPFYEMIIGHPPTVEDMKGITRKEASTLFKVHFWDKMRGDAITDQGVAENIIDHGINSGPRDAGVIAQRVLNLEFGKDLEVDGVIGPKTVAALNSIGDQKALFEKISYYRIKNYEEEAINPMWTRIWINRVVMLGVKFGIAVKKKQ